MSANASSSSRWPTPDAQVFNDSEDPTNWLARNERMRAKHQNGNGMGMSIAMAARTWPTPMVADAGEKVTLASHQPGLIGSAATWSTPRASDGEKGGPNQAFGAGGVPLPAQAAQWETPSVACAMGGQVNRGGRRQNELLLGGQTQAVCTLLAPEISTDGATFSRERRSLNPRFVEWLMGWPLGWTLLVSTSSACSATAFIRFKRHMRSELSQLVSPPAPPAQLSLFG